MRTCANCGTSINDRRSQAIYCGGPCRAAASRKRAAERAGGSSEGPEPVERAKCARKRTQSPTEIVEWASLPSAEQDRIERLLSRHSDPQEAAV
jgi:hypothetical protein